MMLMFILTGFVDAWILRLQAALGIVWMDIARFVEGKLPSLLISTILSDS